MSPNETPLLSRKETPLLSPKETPLPSPKETPLLSPKETPHTQLQPPSQLEGWATTELVVVAAFFIQIDSTVSANVPSPSTPIAKSITNKAERK